MTSAEPVTSDALQAPRLRLRWRNLLQYKLRTLLVCLTVVALWTGWWSHKARQQRAAVAALRDAGALVEYDFQQQGLARPASWPEWLVGALGVDYFAKVHFVYLGDTQVTDAGLEILNGLSALQQLDLAYSQVTDAGLEQLKGLTALESLGLGGRPVTDAGLENLKGLTALEALGLGGTQVTDAGLGNLKGLTALEVLGLGGTQVTDAGLEQLKGLTALEVLYVNDTQVTDSGVTRLQKALPNCEIIR